MFHDLASIGRDPAGPAGKQLAGSSEWWKAYNWPAEGEDDQVRELTGDPTAAAYLSTVREQVRTQLAEALYSGAGGTSNRSDRLRRPGRVASGHRAVGAARPGERRSGCVGRDPQTRVAAVLPGRPSGPRPGRSPPRAVLKWLDRVSDRHGLDPVGLRAWAAAELPHNNKPAPRWVLDTRHLVINLAGTEVWRCERCAWPHLHADAGVCQHCLSDLPAKANAAVSEIEADYYAQLAAAGRPVTRLACRS